MSDNAIAAATRKSPRTGLDVNRWEPGPCEFPHSHADRPQTGAAPVCRRLHASWVREDPANTSHPHAIRPIRSGARP